MLIDADEHLFHQVGRPLSQTIISDHRFFDRHWFGGAHPDGEAAFILGMGCYRNSNVIDGFLSVQRDRKQHNLRLSRVLRPEFAAMQVGPLTIEVIEPFRHLRLSLAATEGMACALDFRSDHAAHTEALHIDVITGMVTQDSTRYDQPGHVTGWIEIEGARIAVDDWWTVRDHSWGVRPGVGGFEPHRGNHGDPNEGHPANQLRLWLWSAFSTDEYFCQFQCQEDATDRRLMLDGQVLFKPELGRAPLRVTDLKHDITLVPGTKAVDHFRYLVTLSDGSTLDIEGEPLVRAWAYRGTGYDRGYRDGLGLGAQRGNLTPEYDVYDLAHPEIVRNPAGEAIGSGHRELPVQIRVNGVATTGHFPIMFFETLIGMA